MLSLVIFGLMFGAMLTVGVALVWAIGGNLRRGDQVRRKLAERLHGLRLGRRLNLLKIDTDAYLHSQRIADIEAQMRECGSCTELERCDESLAKGGGTEEFHFCPNNDSLRVLRDGPVLAQQQ